MQTFLGWLDNRVTRSDTNPNKCISEMFQLRSELSALGEVDSNERMTTIILDALPDETYLTIKAQAIRDPYLR